MIGAMLQVLRKQRGISQDALSSILNVSQQTVSKWETDLAEPDIQALCALADFYGVSIDYLVGRNVDLTSQMEELVKRLTSEQIALLCAVVMKALERT